MKKIISVLITTVASISFTFGAVSISGSAISGLVAADVGKTGVLLVDSTGVGFASLVGATSPIPSAFVQEFSGAVTSSIFGTAFAINPTANIDLVDGVDAADTFGILIFDTVTDYRVFTNAGWVLPSDGGSLTLSGGTVADGASPLGTGSVVPEPSSFALLAGCFGLAWVMVRRRS